MSRTSVVYRTLILMAVDLLAVVSAIGFAHYLRFESGIFPYEEFHPFRNYVGYLSILLLATVPVLAANGLYRPRRSISWVDHIYAIFTSMSVAAAVAMVSSAVMWPDASSSRLMVAIGWLLTIVLVTLGRYVVHRAQIAVRSRGVGVERLLIVGTGEPAHLVLDRVQHSPGIGYRPVGFVAETTGASAIHGLPILGTLECIGEVVRLHEIHDVVIAIPTLSPQQLFDVVTQCSNEKVNIKVFPDLFQFMTSGVNIGDLNGLPLISVKDVALRGWNLALKRAMDILGSAAALVVLSPAMLLIAALIKLSSPDGPVFLIQERVGLDGRPFPIIKFRTMRPDAEKQTGAVWATPNDPRRTTVGGVLRRYSLDELPQLINVLVGDMSLVGPRPERPVFVEQFRRTIPRYFDRHREKAGITGWAQVNGLRGNTSIEERTAYDVWYIENWTLWLDVKILLKTVFVVFSDSNAY
ncbi:MAG TPA: undecaprenyl-phosphate glucose phosphotransferase [Chloroflexota bacterium]|nr:undecaprenyl-phosphate glucose phosphotransferase [Chloroflexota bacterium]